MELLAVVEVMLTLFSIVFVFVRATITVIFVLVPVKRKLPF